jgi:uncharacterized membrane protein
MQVLLNHRYALIAGIVLAVVIALLVGDVQFMSLALARWGHVVSGIFWIGLLYYFNVVQIPALADAAADKGGPGSGGIVKYVAPRALFWFRWAALVTWFTGFWYLMESRNAAAFWFGAGADGVNQYQLVIGIGAWLGTIMLLNVWFVIWPNQKKVIGVVPATDDEKAKARKTATLASRVNFVLSVPMLMCMGGAGHGLPI